MKMTITEMILDIITRLVDCDDCYFRTISNGIYDVEMNDFEGFNDDGSEEYRDFANDDLVDTLFDVLDALSTEKVTHWSGHVTYTVDGHTFDITWSSNEI